MILKWLSVRRGDGPPPGRPRAAAGPPRHRRRAGPRLEARGDGGRLGACGAAAKGTATASSSCRRPASRARASPGCSCGPTVTSPGPRTRTPPMMTTADRAGSAEILRDLRRHHRRCGRWPRAPACEAPRFRSWLVPLCGDPGGNSFGDHDGGQVGVGGGDGRHDGRVGDMQVLDAVHPPAASTTAPSSGSGPMRQVPAGWW